MKTSISKRLFITILMIVLGISAMILLANSLLLKPLYYGSIKSAMLRGMDTLSRVDYAAEWSTLADEIKELTAGNSYGVTALSDDGVLYSDSREFGLIPRGEGFEGEPGETENGIETGDAEPDENGGQNGRSPGSLQGWSGDVRDMINMLSESMEDGWEYVDENTTIGIITEPRTEIAMYICMRETDSGVTIILTQAVEPINQSIWQANLLLIACAAITLGLSAIIVFKLSRRFTEPIRNIKRKVSEIAALQFGEPCNIRTGDELQNLGNDVNLLGDKLQNALNTLRLQNEQLEKDIVAQRQFISNASHELRTPLSLIKGYADEMETGFANNSQQKDIYISIIAEEAGKINRLLKEMLELSRMESGCVAMQQESLSVKERIQIFLEKYDGYIVKNGLKISLKISGKDQGVFDPMYFEQILANYISNASRYGDEQKRIEISSEEKEDSIRVSVFNTGEPVGEEILPRIWDGFYKADNARTRVKDSYGLGLSIVKAIQTAAGQRFGAENVPGGVIFWFDVRRAENGTVCKE